MKTAISLLLIIIFAWDSPAPDAESEYIAANLYGNTNYNEQNTEQTTHKHIEFILDA